MNVGFVALCITCLSAVLLSLSSPLVHAANVHTHGVSTMTIAVDNSTVEVTLTTPTVDLVGFEHTLNAESDKRAFEQMSTQLGQVDDLFVLNGGACQFVSHTVDAMSVEHSDHHDAIEEHLDEHTAQELHSDVTAYYRFNCEKMSELSSITVTVFALFPRIHQIRSMWITDTQQGAVALSDKNNMISLR